MDGHFPKPVKLSVRIAALRVDDNRALVETGP